MYPHERKEPVTVNEEGGRVTVPASTPRFVVLSFTTVHEFQFESIQMGTENIGVAQQDITWQLEVNGVPFRPWINRRISQINSGGDMYVDITDCIPAHSKIEVVFNNTGLNPGVFVVRAVGHYLERVTQWFPDGMFNGAML